MILLTGDKGFIGQFLYKDYTLDTVDYSKVSKVIHCASVSEKDEFKDIKKTTEAMIDLTISIIDKLKPFPEVEFIFCSSMAAEKDLDIYGTYKRAMEFYIQSKFKNFKILRIPRVYSNIRKKGLIKQLNNNTVPEKDMDKLIEFIDLNDFIPQINNIINSKDSKIYYFDKLQTKSIREIKLIYGEDNEENNIKIFKEI